MKNVIVVVARVAFSFLFFLALLCVFSACDADTQALQGASDAQAPYRGPGVLADAGAGLEVQADVVPVVPGTDAGTGTGLEATQVLPDVLVVTPPDTRPAVDTTPACPTVTAISTAITVMATSLDGFCFRTCDSITGVGMTDFLGRRLAVNDVASPYPVGAPATDAYGQQYPDFGARVNGGYVFKISAGSKATASITLYGVSAACP